MGTFLKKDILVLIRDRSELIVLLAMPFILLTILGFSLRGLLGGDTEALHMNVAIVQNDHEEEGIAQFVEDLKASGLPDEAVEALEQTAAEVSPVTLLHKMFASNEVREIIEMTELNEAAAKQQLKEGSVDAIITIPNNFTYRILNKIILDQASGSELEITVNEYSMKTNMLENMMESFVDTLNFEKAVAQAAGESGAAITEAEATEVGGVETITAKEPISSFQYYTIGMAVMFVLFVGSTISSKAFVEKKQHVFHRIMLSGTSPMAYLSGKAIAATVISFLQLVILFSLSALLFQSFSFESVEFWAGMGLISLLLSICVGGFAALLTALSTKWDTDSVSYVFAGGLVTILAFAGGSFFPTTGMPEIVREIGNWTPNGAALTAYLQWMQGLGMVAVWPLLLRIIIITVVLLALSILVFPKRRSV
ncbi:ABC transporter permease [Alkalihalophilus pseudofirmus]|uniref:ABC transporter permease n=1 Tax=Alkalihalophilus pseudofirmus TaxID=79885 RepID=A0AAJ2NMR5_ALKPS|nr:ABC transporter permease [Alkalihalophilus pseudofirmus]MDV2884840.1 ABC transporter permease [Alkalihalophilus pseudofirmus]